MTRMLVLIKKVVTKQKFVDAWYQREMFCAGKVLIFLLTLCSIWRAGKSCRCGNSETVVIKGGKDSSSSIYTWDRKDITDDCLLVNFF
jgi:hypothetical protein